MVGAGGYVCGEGFLNGQLTVTRGLGDFHPEMQDTHELRERLKYAAAGQGDLRLVGPLTAGELCVFKKNPFEAKCSLRRAKIRFCMSICLCGCS